MSSLLFRAQDWLADRVSWVQYPRVRRLSPRQPLFRHGMPWTTRVLLSMAGVGVLAACVIALFFLGLLAWAAITA